MIGVCEGQGWTLGSMQDSFDMAEKQLGMGAHSEIGGDKLFWIFEERYAK